MSSKFGRLFVLSFAVAASAFAQQGKKALDHDVYDSWKSIASTSLSRDGMWSVYAVNPQVGDGNLFIRSTNGGNTMTIERGTLPRFSRDSKYLTTTVVPAKAEVDKARREKKAPKDMPKNMFVVIDLASGKQTPIEKVRSTRFADKDSGWFAYQIEDASAPAAPASGTGPGRRPPTEEEELDQATGTPPAQGTGSQTPPAAQEPKKEESPKKKEHTVGQEWVFRRYSDGKEVKVADIAEWTFSEDGKFVLYAISSKTGETDGLYWMDLETGNKVTLDKAIAQYKQLTIHKDSGKIAFLSDREKYKTEPTEWGVCVWDPKSTKVTQLASNASSGLDKDHVIVTRGGFSFSDNGNRLFFQVAPKPEPEAKDPNPVPDDEKPVVDVWSHTDKMLMPQQLLRAQQERSRTEEAMVDLQSGQVVQIEDDLHRNVIIGDRGNADMALSVDSITHSLASSWGADTVDVYVVNLKTNTRTKVFSNVDWNPVLTLDGKAFYWFDYKKDDYFSYDLASGTITNFTSSIPHTLIDTEDDHPGPRPPAGPTMQMDDGRLLISDGYDMWVCDPRGVRAPWCLTEGMGRSRNWDMTVQPRPRYDGNPGLDTSKDPWIRVVDNDNMDTGYYQESWQPGKSAQKLFMGAMIVSVTGYSESSDKMLITKGRFDTYPNLWLTNTKFEGQQQWSDANPQQKDYIWGTSELVHWTSTDGVPLKGVLVKPENFDPGKKYPMIVYFYELSADQLHVHRVPSPSASTINPTMFASNGYLVFMPDIVYNVGFPGEGAEKCILPGVTQLISRGYVNPKAIGIQGQSWGGYQVMHLITRSNMFAAAGAGAAVSNMTSAYGGIREGSGLVRQFQYEVGQSRIGGSIWDKPLYYIENSPIFWAEKVTTPVLMMNNDKDDAVPFSQGVEMFTALRRNGKKVWMLNYNGDLHNLMKRANRKDLSIRMHQFFDHYLKGAPMPKWMAEGVPATDKGKDLGYQLVGKP